MFFLIQHVVNIIFQIGKKKQSRVDSAGKNQDES